jgi:hypothetical protein
MERKRGRETETDRERERERERERQTARLSDRLRDAEKLRRIR